jgi:two-component system, chemotaxis family, protein-glutamate methylesterase/glutaminase
MPRARILIVDDSAVVRRALFDVISADTDLEVVGTAANGRLALDAIKRSRPDLVTLDIEMPVMDGVTTVSEIRQFDPKLPIMMFSAMTSAGAAATLEALHRGASDFCCKPTCGLTTSFDQVKRELLPKVRALLRLDAPTPDAARVGLRRALEIAPGGATGEPPERIEVVAIGGSTGGPNALASLLPALPANLRAPIVVVQHMPPVFTRLLAERLDARSNLAVVEAKDGMILENGKVLIAPGDHHMVVERDGSTVRVRLNQQPAEHCRRPAVDPLFKSIAAAYGRNALAIMLTGMGRDGARGCQDLRRAGAYLLAQDQESSLVWDMPGSIVEHGLAHEVLPLDRIAGEIVRRTTYGAAPSARGLPPSRPVEPRS